VRVTCPLTILCLLASTSDDPLRRILTPGSGVHPSIVYQFKRTLRRKRTHGSQFLGFILLDDQALSSFFLVSKKALRSPDRPCRIMTMSQSTTSTVEQPRKTITLLNGQIFHFDSNESVDSAQIPVIDVSRIYSDKFEDRQAVAEEIRNASREIGFFYMINHV